MCCCCDSLSLLLRPVSIPHFMHLLHSSGACGSVSVCVCLCDVKSNNILNKMSTRSLNIYWVGKTEHFLCIFRHSPFHFVCQASSLLWPKFGCASLFDSVNFFFSTSSLLPSLLLCLSIYCFLIVTIE